MSVRLPLTAVLDYNNTTEVGVFGASSVNGGVAKTFFIPQDTDNVVVKYQTSTVGGGASALFQTSDDGGTTWYDVARTSVVSNANATTAQWLSIPVIGAGITNVVASTVAGGSVVSRGTTTGSAAASTLAAGGISGLPILGLQNRVFIQYGATIASVKSERVTVYVNNQSNRA